MRGKMLAEVVGLECFKASTHWVSNFKKWNGFSLGKITNLTTLLDDQLLQNAGHYMKKTCKVGRIN